MSPSGRGHLAMGVISGTIFGPRMLSLILYHSPSKAHVGTNSTTSVAHFGGANMSPSGRGHLAMGVISGTRLDARSVWLELYHFPAQAHVAMNSTKALAHFGSANMSLSGRGHLAMGVMSGTS